MCFLEILCKFMQFQELNNVNPRFIKTTPPTSAQGPLEELDRASLGFEGTKGTKNLRTALGSGSILLALHEHGKRKQALPRFINKNVINRRMFEKKVACSGIAKPC